MQKWELQPALHSFLSEKTLPSARNAMNNIKSGEVMKLKDLISYEEGSIANLDVVVPLTGNLPTLRQYFWLTYYPPAKGRFVALRLAFRS